MHTLKTIRADQSHMKRLALGQHLLLYLHRRHYQASHRRFVARLADRWGCSAYLGDRQGVLGDGSHTRRLDALVLQPRRLAPAQRLHVSDGLHIP